MTNLDFRDLLFELNAAEVRYLVVGAYAVVFHTRPRYTKDLDLWIEATPDNAARAWRALAAFGAPMKGVTPADLCDPSVVFQVGVEPNRVDVLTSVTPLDFESAWSRRVRATYGDCVVHYLSRDDLAASKRAAGRPKDLEDLRWLETTPDP